MTPSHIDEQSEFHLDAVTGKSPLIVEPTSRRQLAFETVSLAGGLGFAWLFWPSSWDDMAGLMVLFSSPCCVIPTTIHLLGVPFLIAATVFAWSHAWRAGVPVGLVAFTVAVIVGLAGFLAHTGDSTEFPPHPYLWCGWAMLAGAVACTAELRWRGGAWVSVGGPQWAAVPVFLLKPFTDIAFAGV